MTLPCSQCCCCIAELQASEEKQLVSCRARLGARGTVVVPTEPTCPFSYIRAGAKHMGLSTPHSGGHALSMALVCPGTDPLLYLLHRHLTHPGYAEQRLSLLLAAHPLPVVRVVAVWSVGHTLFLHPCAPYVQMCESPEGMLGMGWWWGEQEA